MGSITFHRCTLAAVLVCGAAARAAAGPALAPVTDRDYAIELYDGVALGSTALVGMGGAGVALASDSAGTLINVAAPAVRLTTDKDSWNWGFHVDYLNADGSSDYANTGLGLQEGGTSIFTAGLSLRIHDWAAAVTVTDLSVGVATQPGQPSLYSSTVRYQLALAKWIPQIDVAAGIALQAADFDLYPDCTDQMPCMDLFGVTGDGFEAGAIWSPRMTSLRIGANYAAPIDGGGITYQDCDPTNCEGFILPDSVVSAWRASLGVAYRFAPTAWNQLVSGYFRDERSLTVALDLAVTGAEDNAYGLEAFGQHELEPSGRDLAWSPRGGVEFECFPGRLRLLAGSYWEPQRYDGVPGRLHGTFGVELRMLQFNLLKVPRRGRISITGDLAEGYRNIGVSVGFWH
ncbi:MAG TPA: hypothetical protein VLX92_15205 [Kofleriaceae bacterium]|nr:hypothetical protein [Kofleriaceae bacterium]